MSTSGGTPRDPWSADPDDRRSNRERWLAGDPYVADAEVAASSQRAARLTAAYGATTPDDVEGRRALLRELFAAIGEETVLLPPISVDHGHLTRIGARTFVNYGLVALDAGPITIGDDVQIGPGVQLLTATHPLDAALRRAKWESAEPITIGDNAWLGGGVVVLPGVTIGADTVVGAGSVVVRDLPAGVLAVGSPARVVRHL